MAEFSDKFLDEAVDHWQPRLRRSLSREDARTIAANLLGLFQLLDEWDKADQPTAGPTADRVEFETTTRLGTVT